MDSKKIQTSYKAIVQSIKSENSPNALYAPKQIKNHRNLTANEAKEKNFGKIANVPQCGSKRSKTFSNFQ